ncbi:uncharacterized protein LOC128263656 [Drosophila gunungcola]|uniref:uncharacterized protein LOC128263656 n=1 Tax=Drosophila gunungcola TaxID=103775 RepID=UPI0022E41E59|nr:uncharacterized protein LOC128263656 [Drosophila gunungcola]
MPSDDEQKNDFVNVMQIDMAENNSELNINEQASAFAKAEVRKIVTNYKPLHTKSTKIEMRIVLKDDTPIFARPRRLPFAEARLVEEQVEEWLQNGIIEESDSEFTSPVVMVKKTRTALHDSALIFEGSISGQYQFLKVPFGLSNSPGVFQRHVNAIFRQLTRKGIALPYIDDVIIPALNEENAVLNLKEVMVLS